MKLIIQNDRIAATATDEYQTNGTEQAVLDAPVDFDVARIGEYAYANEGLTIAAPQSVTRRQARQALLLAGLLDLVPTKIAAIPDAAQRGLAQIEWEDSQVFERDRPLLIAIGTALGMTSAQLDTLFIQAAAL